MSDRGQLQGVGSIRTTCLANATKFTKLSEVNKVKVFISWSGERGKKIGEAFKQLLPDVIQSIEPFYSPDIEKGQRWSAEIEKNLKDSKVGIICVTPESMISPWLMFESGAISNAKLSSVCPLLFQVEPAQLQGPLSQFQATPYSESEIRKLLFSINEFLSVPLNEAQLNRTFDRCWSEFNKAIEEALEINVEAKIPERRPDVELIEEILSTVRMIANNVPEEDSANHWIVLYTTLTDFGNQMAQIGQSELSDKDVEMLKCTLKNMRTSLNLAQPKIAKALRSKELALEAKAMMAKLESAINDLDIPF